MLSLDKNYTYYLYNGDGGYVDMRKGLHSLAALVREGIGEDPINSSNVYIFMGKSRRIIKILRYERGCFVLYEKRSLHGKFRKVQLGDSDKSYCISWTDLMCLLEGVVIETMTVQREEPRLVLDPEPETGI